MPTVLLFLGLGEIEVSFYPLRLLGLALGLSGAGVLVWASVSLGRFLLHEPAVLQNHALITSGPYRLVRHPIYSGYLALLMGSGLAMLNVWLLLLWPLSLSGILIEAESEERLLESKFGQLYTDYAARTGRLVPRSWGAAG
jgi:protein-S-isoprenylcysteine O-methyltransferase Ste14